MIRERFGAEAFRAQMTEFAAIAHRQFGTGQTEYWPATNPDGMPAGLPGPDPCLVHIDPPRLITPLGGQLQQRIAPADDGGRQAVSGMMRHPAP